jgi:DNA-binding MarR family transcriptional regulator
VPALVRREADPGAARAAFAVITPHGRSLAATEDLAARDFVIRPGRHGISPA